MSRPPRYSTLLLLRVIGLVALALSSSTAAGESDNNDEAVLEAVRSLVPGDRAIDIRRSPVPGVREVAVGTQVFYVTGDGRYMLGGPLVDRADGRNLTDVAVARGRRALLDDAANLQPFRWAADNERHAITVVTDIDCPYCRRLHKTIPEFNAAGITVQYVMLPRAGKPSASYDKTVGAACATDPEAAITAAMGGATHAAAECVHPIDKHMAMARDLGIGSTPSIIFDDGRMVLGQRSVDDVLALLEDALTKKAPVP